ncbi:uncharacterized protein [Malus domestica]|uniref:uncharacterized protein n=1 Tax=Malus domestica TaxID=3750 RepID=UPI003975AD6F
MLAGVKIIPRDQIDKDENLSAPGKEKQKQKKRSSSKVNKRRKEKKSSQYGSSDGEELDKIKKGSKNKWYSSDEYSTSSSYSSGVESEGSSDRGRRKSQSRKKGKRSNEGISEDKVSYSSKKRSKNGRKEYASEDHSSSASDGKDSDSCSDRKERRKKGSKKDRKKKSKRMSRGVMEDEEISDGDRGAGRLKDGEIARKEFGLEWMLRPEGKADRTPTVTVKEQPKETPSDEIKVNPRELNPHLKDDGSGYPEDTDEPEATGNKLLSSSVVGDGGASWKLKALKRAKEQATREGRRLQEVVGERWGSLGELTVSVASNKAAQSRAHLHAIKSRQKGLSEEHQPDSSNQSDMDNKKDTSRHYLKDVSCGLPKWREPKIQDSLSWKRRDVSTQDSSLLAEAVANLNQFSNDGSFMSDVLRKRTDDFSSPTRENIADTSKPSEASAAFHELNANQLAAKAFQLRMKGKLEEAGELLEEVENRKAKQASGDNFMRPRNERSTSRHVMQEMALRQKKKEEDADMHLAQRITQNKKYSISGQADDEYDYDDTPRKKSKKKQGSDQKVTQNNSFATRFATQQERCLFCFENQRRPAHLVVAIANFTYLMLPHQQPVVPGHCCIIPMQHVPSTRTVDDDVWQEIRNFKKCLIMMFAKKEKEVVFLETVMGLAQQRHHCIVECIPIPHEIAKEAPLYFKKAIDEAEDEWSQHNAKRLIDTSVKGLRGSIPKDFPYFHVEFGLNKGFVHVIDDEQQFNSSLGLNVIRGMLQLPEEDMYRRRRHETVEAQKQAVKSFDQDWSPFDWTKQLHQS